MKNPPPKQSKTAAPAKTDAGKGRKGAGKSDRDARNGNTNAGNGEARPQAMDVRFAATLLRVRSGADEKERRERRKKLAPASAAELIRCFYGTRWVQDEDLRKEYRDAYPDVHKAFEAHYGRIVEHYSAEHSISAVLRTDQSRLELVWGSVKDHRLGSMLSEIEGLSIRARRLLDDGDRRLFVIAAFGLASRIINDIDQVDGRISDEAVAAHGKDLERLKKLVDLPAARRARMRYTAGTGFGFIALFVLVLVLWATPSDDPDVWLRIWHGSGAAIGGGLGALLSVVLRLQSNQLKLDYDVGPDLVLRMGMLRPVVGAMSSMVIVLLILTEFLPLSAPEGVARFDWYMAIGFFAGFSERWAKDALSITPGSVGGGDGGKAGGDAPPPTPTEPRPGGGGAAEDDDEDNRNGDNDEGGDGVAAEEEKKPDKPERRGPAAPAAPAPAVTPAPAPPAPEPEAEEPAGADEEEEEESAEEAAEPERAVDPQF